MIEFEWVLTFGQLLTIALMLSVFGPMLWLIMRRHSEDVKRVSRLEVEVDQLREQVNGLKGLLLNRERQ